MSGDEQLDGRVWPVQFDNGREHGQLRQFRRVLRVIIRIRLTVLFLSDEQSRFTELLELILLRVLRADAAVQLTNVERERRFRPWCMAGHALGAAGERPVLVALTTGDPFVFDKEMRLVAVGRH